MDFSARLKELRTKKDLSQKDLAKKINVTYRAIQKYESGEAKPRNNNLVALAKVFNVSVSYLLGETNMKDSDEIVEIMEKLSTEEQQEVIRFAQHLLDNKKSTKS